MFRRYQKRVVKKTHVNINIDMSGQMINLNFILNIKNIWSKNSALLFDTCKFWDKVRFNLLPTKNGVILDRSCSKFSTESYYVFHCFNSCTFYTSIHNKIMNILTKYLKEFILLIILKNN